MKIPVMFYVASTIIMMITVTIMVSMEMPFNWVFYLICLDQFMVAVMVYKVLTDGYKTDKTFVDFYEEYPIGNKQVN